VGEEVTTLSTTIQTLLKARRKIPELLFGGMRIFYEMLLNGSDYHARFETFRDVRSLAASRFFENVRGKIWKGVLRLFDIICLLLCLVSYT